MSENVISMFGGRKPKPKKDEEEMSFAEIMKKNQENEERVAKERARANKSVCRSHRLTNNKR